MRGIQELTGDCSVCLIQTQKEVDQRVSDILNLQDADLVWDLRVNNQGRPEQSSEFLEQCQIYISNNVLLMIEDMIKLILREMLLSI